MYRNMRKLCPNNDQFRLFRMIVFVGTEKEVQREVLDSGTRAFYPPLAGLSPRGGPRWDR